MKPGQKRLLRSSQAVRIAVLSLITGIVTVTLSNSLATTEDDRQHRLFKDGRAIIGGLISIHTESDEYNKCHDTISPQWLGHAEAISYAIENINKNKFLLPNFTLGYDIRDVCTNEIIAARYAYQFATASTMNCQEVRCISNHKCLCIKNGSSVEEEVLSNNYRTTYPVVAIVGKISSQIAIPLANFLQAVRLPFIGTSATTEELSSPVYNSILRTIPADINQAKAFADFIERFGWRYVGAVAVDDSYGRYGVNALERESIQRKTFCLELFGYVPLLKHNDQLKGIVSSLKLRETVKIIIVWAHSIHGRRLLKEAAKQGLKNRIWMFSEAVAMLRPEYLSPIRNLSSTGVHVGFKVQSQVPQSFLRYLEKKMFHNHSEEEHFWWKQFWKSVGKANESSPSPDNTEPKRSLLHRAHDDFVIYIIDAIYSIAHALDQMLRCKSANFPPSIVQNVCPDINKTVQTGKLIEYLKKVEFKGLSGKVQYDSRGDPLEAIYDIVYFNISEEHGNQRVTKDVIGQWKKNSMDRLQIGNPIILLEQRKNISTTCIEECKPGQWKVTVTECCWKCLPCNDGSVSETEGALSCTKCTKTQMSNFKRTQCIPLPITNIDWSDTLAVILTIISVLGIVIDVSVFGILWYFRDTPMVRALNKVCTLVVLLGIAMCFGMTLLYIIRPSSGYCSVLKPLRYVVYTVCLSALFLKTMQIVHAFNISRHKSWVKAFICSTKRQVIVLLAIIGIEVLLGAMWILLDPPYAHVTIVPKIHVFTSCVPFSGTPGKVLDSLMIVYLVLVAGCCICYAFRARNLPANFNEAKYISFSLYIFLLSWIAYYPVDYATEGWYVAVLSGTTLLLSSYGLLLCMLGPKVYIMIWHPEKNTVVFLRAEMRQSQLTQTVNDFNSVRPAKEKT